MALIPCRECGKEISDQAPACPHCGAPISPAVSAQTPQTATSPQKAKRKTSCFTAGCAVVLGGGLLVFIIGLIAQGGKPIPKRPPSPKEVALQNVEMVDFTWSKEGFGSVMEATFMLRNNNDFAVKDIKIKCTHTAKSGTVIDSNTRTIYDVIEAKSKKNIRGFNMGFIHNQVDRSSCEITAVVVVEKTP